MLIIKYSSTVMQGKRKLCECHTRFFFIVRIQDLKFSLVLCSRSRYMAISKNLEKMEQEHPFLNEFYQKLKTPIHVMVQLNIKYYEIQCIIFRVVLATKCLSYRRAERFQKQSNRFQNIPLLPSPQNKSTKCAFLF